MPATPEHVLAEGVSYHWYLKLYCETSKADGADLEVDGWVQRVNMNAARERAIDAAGPEIWYDSLAQLGSLLRTSPQDSELQNRWHNLLEYIDSEDLAQEPLVGPVQADMELE